MAKREKKGVSPETAQQFFENYLTSGNVLEAARKAGINLERAYALQAKGLDDAEFTEQRTRIRNAMLPDGELMAFEALQRLAEEVKRIPAPSPLDQAFRRLTNRQPALDPRQKMYANMARLLNVIVKSQGLSKNPEWDGGEGHARGPVVINVHPTARAQQTEEG